jgi:hypothetical protein
VLQCELLIRYGLSVVVILLMIFFPRVRPRVGGLRGAAGKAAKAASGAPAPIKVLTKIDALVIRMWRRDESTGAGLVNMVFLWMIT